VSVRSVSPSAALISRFKAPPDPVQVGGNLSAIAFGITARAKNETSKTILFMVVRVLHIDFIVYFIWLIRSSIDFNYPVQPNFLPGALQHFLSPSANLEQKESSNTNDLVPKTVKKIFGFPLFFAE
jgi:hypothetical protein